MINIVGLREQLHPDGLPEPRAGQRAWLFRAGRLSVVRIERRHDGLMRASGRIVPAARVRIGAVSLRVARVARGDQAGTRTTIRMGHRQRRNAGRA